MKKTIALLLILSLLGCAALAARIEPLPGVDMSQSLDDSQFSVCIADGYLNGNVLKVMIYNRQTYAAADVEKLQVGDSIVFMGKEYPIESITLDNSLYINGDHEINEEESSFTLVRDEVSDSVIYPEAKDGSYTGFYYESPEYLEVGQAEFPLADEIIYRHWQPYDEEGGIAEEMSTDTVTPDEFKAILEANSYTPDDPNDEIILLAPEEAVIRTEGGRIVELDIYYRP